jgi:hypothetical protein
MSITGTGTQADPYVVTTYAELVEKAAESGVYIKVGNDINITSEYPEGNMPTLTVNSPIDGDGHVISNWYRTVGAELIYITDANHVDNLTIKNIYVTYTGDIFTLSSNSYWKFNNCKFSGYVRGRLYSGSNPYNHFKNCSFNIKSGNSGSSNYIMNSNCLNCYIHIHFTKDGGNGLFGNNAKVENSYIEATADDSVKNVAYLGQFGSVTNCVIDSYLTASQSLESYSSSGADLSIINSTHAPNYTVSGKLALVDDEHWLDTAYLASIGFNAG